MKKLKRFIKDLISLFFVLDKKNYAFLLFSILKHLPDIAKNKNLKKPYGAMAGRRCVFRVFGRKIVLDGKWFGYASEIYGRKVYFAVPGFELRPNMMVVDLGASGGIFTVLAAKICKQVYAVEARQDSFRELTENIKRNNCADNTEAVWGMVGADSGVFSKEKELRRISEDGIPPRVTLSGIVTEYGIPRIDFLKIDIEGSEFALFRSDTGWLEKTERIAMEVHSEFGNPAELVLTLQKYGFQTHFVDVNQKTVRGLEGNSGYLFALRNVTR